VSDWTLVDVHYDYMYR